MRYAIWDKVSPVITPIGEYLTAEEWMTRYPVARVDSIKIVCGGGDINGSYFGLFSDLVNMYKEQGCDFSSCVEDQDFLDAIENFENIRNATANENDGESSTEERIAAALEYANLLNSTIVNTDDPDEE